MDLTRVHSSLAFSLPLFNSSSFSLLGILLGDDIPHGIFPFWLSLLIDGGDFEPVAVDDVLSLPVGKGLFDYTHRVSDMLKVGSWRTNGSG